MKHLKFIFILFFSFFSWNLLAQTTMVPSVCSYKKSRGVLQLGKNVEMVGFTPDVYASKTLLEDVLTKLSSTEKAHQVYLETNTNLPSDGSYRILISASDVRIEASSTAGFCYGLNTLTLLAEENEGAIKQGVIEDKPRLGWRGFMLDESRHFFGKEKVKQYLDLMFRLKMNVFHWHLTDEPGWRIEIKKYPKLTTEGSIGNYHDPKAPATFYTQDDIKEIVAYAAERSIMVVPEIDMPGHATAACRSYPEISGGGEGRWKHFTFHPCKEETFSFINDVLDEVVALFPAPYIHVGGDEVHFGNQEWFTDPDIQKFIKDHDLKNETGLEHYFIRRIADMVAKKGKKLIGWDEIVDADVAPSKAIVMWWRHDRKYQLYKALERGYEVVLTPRRPLYGDFIQYASHKQGRVWNGFNMLADIHRFPDSLGSLTDGYEEQIKGMQFNMWTEVIADNKRLDFMTFPRLIAVAESAWADPKVKEYSLFMSRLPYWLRLLDNFQIYYFNPFCPEKTPEPLSPERDDVLRNG